MAERSSKRPTPETPGPAVNHARRGLLRAVFGTLLGWGFATLGATVALWSAATARLLFPNVVTEPPRRFKIGPPGNYPPGRVETRFKEQHGIWVVHGVYDGQAQIFALRTVCTHLGCITLWQESEQKFKCPCHGSGFSREGIHLEGPAPRPLERCALGIADDGQLEVDTGRTFQQELGQWNDPASYVAV